MLNPFICGSFHHEEEEDNQETWSRGSSPCSTPRKSSRRSSRDSKNPYSSRGLDKFSALVADHEEKRQKIYSQTGSDQDTLIRFVYSNSNDVVPIIVRLKDHNNKQDKKTKIISNAKDAIVKPNEQVVDKLPVDESVAEKEVQNQSKLETKEKTKNKGYFNWNLKSHRWRRPSYYMPVAIVLILLMLVFLGRSVAILCTSIGWYIVPTLRSKKPAKKKVYMRRFSEIKVRNVGLSPPKSNNTIGAAVRDKSPRQQGHRKSF